MDLSRGLGDVYKRQIQSPDAEKAWISTSDRSRAAKWKAAGYVVIESKQAL
jgi:hypothetical protein